jgi:hypothetical protein
MLEEEYVKYFLNDSDEDQIIPSQFHKNKNKPLSSKVIDNKLRTNNSLINESLNSTSSTRSPSTKSSHSSPLSNDDYEDTQTKRRKYLETMLESTNAQPVQAKPGLFEPNDQLNLLK